jgi:phosphoesterase RecJ-like protein
MEDRAAQWIASKRDLLILCHHSPDGDALGSLLGLGLALERLAIPGRPPKTVHLVCADPVAEDARHLPGWERIVTPESAGWVGRSGWLSLPEAGSGSSSGAGPQPAVISVDCSSLDRLGAAYDATLWAGIPLLNIDHHPTNTCFGQLNWVEPDAAATAQMLVRLVRALNVPLEVDIATCLLHGILTDTQGFRTPNTSPDVLRTAVELMDRGAPFSALNDLIFNRRPLSAIQLWSLALPQMTLQGRILSSAITQDMRQRAGYDLEGSAGLVSYLNTANEADIAVVFDERPDGTVGVSMRSVLGIDVSQVAVALGGGGHAQAAGCTVPGPLGAAQEQVLSRLHETWASQALPQAHDPPKGSTHWQPRSPSVAS